MPQSKLNHRVAAIQQNGSISSSKDERRKSRLKDKQMISGALEESTILNKVKDKWNSEAFVKVYKDNDHWQKLYEIDDHNPYLQLEDVVEKIVEDGRDIGYKAAAIVSKGKLKKDPILRPDYIFPRHGVTDLTRKLLDIALQDKFMAAYENDKVSAVAPFNIPNFDEWCGVISEWFAPVKSDMSGLVLDIALETWRRQFSRILVQLEEEGFEYVKDGKLTPLSIDEAVEKLNKGNHSGYPYFTSKWNGDGLNAHILEEMKIMAECSTESGEHFNFFEPLWILFSRTARGKHRGVMGGAGARNIKGKQYSFPFTEMMKVVNEFCGFNGGENVHGDIAMMMLTHAMAAESDFKDHDKLASRLFMYCVDIMRGCFPEEHKDVFESYVESIASFALMTPAGLVTPGTFDNLFKIISGDPFTSIIGTLVATIAAEYSVVKIILEDLRNKEKGDTNFKELIDFILNTKESDMGAEQTFETYWGRYNRVVNDGEADELSAGKPTHLSGRTMVPILTEMFTTEDVNPGLLKTEQYNGYNILKEWFIKQRLTEGSVFHDSAWLTRVHFGDDLAIFTNGDEKLLEKFINNVGECGTKLSFEKTAYAHNKYVEQAKLLVDEYGLRTDIDTDVHGNIINTREVLDVPDGIRKLIIDTWDVENECVYAEGDEKNRISFLGWHYFPKLAFKDLVMGTASARFSIMRSIAPKLVYDEYWQLNDDEINAKEKVTQSLKDLGKGEYEVTTKMLQEMISTIMRLDLARNNSNFESLVGFVREHSVYKLYTELLLPLKNDIVNISDIRKVMRISRARLRGGLHTFPIIEMLKKFEKDEDIVDKIVTRVDKTGDTETVTTAERLGKVQAIMTIIKSSTKTMNRPINKVITESKTSTKEEAQALKAQSRLQKVASESLDLAHTIMNELDVAPHDLMSDEALFTNFDMEVCKLLGKNSVNPQAPVIIRGVAKSLFAKSVDISTVYRMPDAKYIANRLMTFSEKAAAYSQSIVAEIATALYNNSDPITPNKQPLIEAYNAVVDMCESKLGAR
jgi:hypothetical protein